MDEELQKIEKFKKQLGNIADKINLLVDMNETEQQKLFEGFKSGFKNQKDTSMWNLMILIVLVGLIFSVLVFFGYKLYKSLAEKERKRDEKRKMKQMKKKK